MQVSANRIQGIGEGGAGQRGEAQLPDCVGQNPQVDARHQEQSQHLPFFVRSGCAHGHSLLLSWLKHFN